MEENRWRSRIVSHGEADPQDLLANPLNWRIHPSYQQEALQGILDEVGWVQEIIVNQRTGFVVDGHLRIALALRKGEPRIPVTYVDLSEEEEGLILAVLDPIAAMAETDEKKLQEVLASLPEPSEEMKGVLDMVAREAGVRGGLLEITGEGSGEFAGPGGEPKPDYVFEVVLPSGPEGVEAKRSLTALCQTRGWPWRVNRNDRTGRPDALEAGD